MNLQPLDALLQTFLAICFCFLVSTNSHANDQVAPAETLSEKPNVLWIYVDDMSDWLSCYGDGKIQTPNIDQLAKNGIRFENTFMPSPVCSTTRSALITGTIQTSLGLHQHRTMLKQPLPESIQTVPEIFRKAGYITFNESKDDYNFVRKRHSLYSPEFIRPRFKGHLPVTGSAQKAALTWLKQLQGKPFFGQIQLKGGKIGGETGSQYPADSRIAGNEIKVPPQYPDNDVFRNAIARHYEQILQTDDQVGLIIKALKDYGLWDSTIVFFFTDHGSPLPRSKQFLYDEGTKVPLIVRIPQPFQPPNSAAVRSDLVSGLDISATSLGLANLSIPKDFDGFNLFSNEYRPRKYVISARDRCGIAVDRIRSVRTNEFRYLKNYNTDRALYQSNYRDQYATFQNLHALSHAKKLTPVQQSYLDASQRPAEELYRVLDDPHQIKNLADDPKFRQVLQRHRRILAHWETESNDQGIRRESKASLKLVYEGARGKVTAPEFDFLKSKKE